MRTPLSQDSRTAVITTPLGQNALLLSRFDGTEHVDGVFTYHVDAMAENAEVNPNDLVGTNLTVALSGADLETQYFDGIVTQARQVGVTEGHAKMRITLEPWFALLRHRRNQRIWHEKSVVEILEELFAPYSGFGQPALQLDLNGSYDTLEYTVQYGESDFAFACRMMERFGISYYFTHAEGSHTMVLNDTMTNYPDIGERSFLSNRDARGEHFWDWQRENNMTTGAGRLMDYNFKTPNAMMEVDNTGLAEYQNGEIESYDYPGGYLSANGDGPCGNDVVMLRVEQARAADDRHRAAGDIVTLRAGSRVTLTGQANPGVVDQGYLCLLAHHAYSAGNQDSTSRARSGDGGTHHASYVLTNAILEYRPPMRTPRARVQGIQTAFVVGPEGEEIHCDEYGRIKVRFHWDLNGDWSMWCRVSQNWSGNGWGGMVIPRIGMEVVVDFLEGDPDKPLVTGCVYNGRSAVPYELPNFKTRSTFKTDTHQGEGFNELRFEDLNGEEEIFIHAQKDFNAKIENNATERVNVNKVESVGHNRASETHNNETNVVGGDWEIFVGPAQRGRHTPGSAASETQGIGGEGYGLGEAGSGEGQGNLTMTVENNRNEEIGNNDTLNVGVNKSETVGTNYTVDVGNNLTFNVGTKVTINCGSSQLTLDNAGNIVLNGTKIDLKASSLIKLAAASIKLN